MTTKELVIELRIPLSGDMFEDAATITRVGDLASMIKERAAADLGETGFALEVSTTREKTPRGPRSDAGVPRGPRKRANGQKEQGAQVS